MRLLYLVTGDTTHAVAITLYVLASTGWLLFPRQGSPERELSLLLEAYGAEDGDGGRLGHWMVATDWHLADQIRFAWAARWDSKVKRQHNHIHFPELPIPGVRYCMKCIDQNSDNTSVVTVLVNTLYLSVFQ